jgi:hypothetical protein
MTDGFGPLPGARLSRRGFLAGAGALALAPAVDARSGARFSLGELKARTFAFFRETTDPATGLAPDRWPSRGPSSIAAIGFALTAWPIGERRGWIGRTEARNRTLMTLRYLWSLPQGPDPVRVSGHRGFFYHFLDREVGFRYRTTELSTIDTGLMMMGVLFAQSWFDRPDPAEAEIRDLAERLYTRVEWTWARPNPPFLSMGWMPETGFIPSDWDHFDESPFLYLLALGSPTFPIEPAAWTTYTDSFDAAWGGGPLPHFQFPPMFGHQYGHCWIDFRGIRDPLLRRRDLDWFENSRRAVLAQQDYAARNPGGWRGYDATHWGLTACDGPGEFTAEFDGRPRRLFAYAARGAWGPDDGTIAPTAAGGSIPFAPRLCTAALAEMHRRHAPLIWGRYGFLDSFNAGLTETRPISYGRIVRGAGWVSDDWLGIDQGPILAMTENHDSGLVWRIMRRNPHIRRGLARAGFSGSWLGRTR